MAVTGYSGFWGGANQYSLLDDKSPVENVIATFFRVQPQAILQELFDTLLGAAVGGTASANQSRVPHNESAGSTGNQGGLLVAETTSVINRVTTSADLAALKDIISRSVEPTYVADLSGNGSQG